MIRTSYFIRDIAFVTHLMHFSWFFCIFSRIPEPFVVVRFLSLYSFVHIQRSSLIVSDGRLLVLYYFSEKIFFLEKTVKIHEKTSTRETTSFHVQHLDFSSIFIDFHQTCTRFTPKSVINRRNDDSPMYQFTFDDVTILSS
jgi:hypothetical protein